MAEAMANKLVLVLGSMMAVMLLIAVFDLLHPVLIAALVVSGLAVAVVVWLVTYASDVNPYLIPVSMCVVFFVAPILAGALARRLQRNTDRSEGDSDGQK